MKLKGSTIVLTGKFKKYSRADAKKVLTKKGAKVSSSVSGKTDFIIAGPGAGSKIQDAFDKKVPILGEGHLAMILDGMPLKDVIELANTFYTLEDCSAEEAKGTHNMRGGIPPVWADQKQEFSKDCHMFTLDCSTMPALQAFLPGVRTVTVGMAGYQNKEMWQANEYGSSVTLSTQEELDAIKPLKGQELAGRYFKPVAHTFNELSDRFARGRILGGVPCWCQYDESPRNGLFLGQFGEGWGLSGDGLVYLFDTGMVGQIT